MTVFPHQIENYHYQVGGTLAPNAPSYIPRQADSQLYQALKQGQFCYVFNCRQMGKSSLLLQTKNRLLEENFKCASLDLSIIGNDQVTPTQWYKGLVLDLWQEFGLVNQFNFKKWWQEQEDLSLLQRVRRFISEVLLAKFPQQRLFILIDEVDSILSLNFPVDDLFVLIRYCYNQRAIDPRYNYITFALFGVTTPSELIQDPTRTPFNIGKAIKLNGFTFEEALPLAKGLNLKGSDPLKLLQEILAWTGGQPFLTQKLCNHVCQLAQQIVIEPDTEAIWLEKLVKESILNEWEFQDEPEHLRTIQNQIESYGKQTSRILGIYQQIVQGIAIKSDGTPAQTELLISGLVVKQNGYLKIKNRIYEEIFNLQWVKQQLQTLRPYAESLQTWLDSDRQDCSRLLRGKALKEAQNWAKGKSLSDLDYQFLAASEEHDRQEIQLVLKVERAKAIAAQLKAEQQQRLQVQKNAKLQQCVLIVVSCAFLISSGLGIVALWQYRQARISEIKALASSSQGLFVSNHQLDAMIEAIKAKIQLQKLRGVDSEITNKVEAALRQTVYGNNEFNRLIGHQGSVLTVDISPNNQLIATGSNDKTVKIWKRDGTLLQTLQHSATIHRLAFSPDSRQIVSGSLDGTLSLWNIDGTLIKKIQAHQAPIWGVAVSPDGKIIASASGDQTIKLWQMDGKLLNTLTGHSTSVWSVAFSNDGQIIASAGLDHQVKLWQLNGKQLKTLPNHQAPVWDVAFCRENNLLVSVSSDRTAQLSNLNGTIVKTLHSDKAILGVDCQGQYIATSGRDNQVKIWRLDGTFIRNLKGHRAVIRDVALNSQGTMAISASDDGTVKLWQRNQYLLKHFYGHQDTIWELATSGNNQLIASVSVDNSLKLWQINGKLWQSFKDNQFSFRAVTFSADSKHLITAATNNNSIQIWQLGNKQPTLKLIKSFQAHQAAIFAVAINSSGTAITTEGSELLTPCLGCAERGSLLAIASAGDDHKIKLWDQSGKLLHSWFAHQERIWKLAFTPDGQILVSASEDGTVKLWTKQRKPLAILRHEGAVWGVAINPQGNLIASTSRDDTLRLWHKDGTLIKIIPGQSQGLTRVAFSPDGQTIATGGVDNTVKLWNINGKLLKILPGHQGIVISLAFTPDGKFLLSGGDDSTLIRWDLQKICSLNELEYACNWVQDYLRTNSIKEERYLCDKIVEKESNGT
jgi:WD40 repeat protein